VPENQAAWLMARHARLEVKSAPYPQPAAGEIVVRNCAVAINPVDWAIQYLGRLLFPWLKYPAVLGSDLAGDVVAVGEGVTEVKVGDRVLAIAAGVSPQRNRPAEGAFQSYPIVLPRLTTIIPERMSYEEAAVIPLGIVTAACGLFQRDLLALDLPTPGAPIARDLWVIIWGGATSVGCNAIQLAAAAGYPVITTCSPKNFDLVKSLGAAHAFDYRSKTVVADIVAAVDGKPVAGVLAIGAGSASPLVDILSQCEGPRFIANCSAPIPFDAIGKGARITLPVMLRLLPQMLLAQRAVAAKSRRTGIKVQFFDAGSVLDNELGPAIFRDFLGPALAARRFRPAPPPRVVGHGLAAIQSAFDIQRAGVSATKVVVSL